MKTPAVGMILLLAVIGPTSATAVNAKDWDAANAATVRLKPAAFATLPVTVRSYLEQRGCAIPQSVFDKTPHNVVRGRFTAATRTDIAILCSIDKVSTVLVFPGGGTSEVLELARRPDKGFLQVVKPGVVGYARVLGVADRRYIRKHHAAYGGLQPPALDHDGINDTFVEKASVVWYWYQDKWLKLQGAD
jgi:hypothetical protein